MQSDPPQSTATHDYVVVGTGAAGSIVAARLSEDHGVTVCALESGPPDRHPYIHIPAGFIKIMFNEAYTWQLKTEPAPGVNGRAVSIPIGRTVGGSSSINGMIINRGQADDFNAWAQRGNLGWGYADLLPYFKRFERRIGDGDDTYRGRDGKIPVTDLDWGHEICDAFVEGAVGLGIPRNRDYNGAAQPGVGFLQRCIENGLRRSAGRTYLLPAIKSSKRIDLRTHARAFKILFEGRKAVGVRYVDERSRAVHEVRARREVIVCGGTANSPRLLQLSGVGDPGLLASLGVDVVHALPAVGENFRDHCSVRVVARAKNATTINEITRGLPLAGQVLRWLTGRPSVIGVSPSLCYCFWRSDESISGADLQLVFAPASYKEGFVGMLDDYPGMSCGVWQHRPESTGYVRAKATDIFVDPAVQPNYLSHETDQRAMVGGIKLARRLLQTPQLARFVDAETFPGKGVQSDGEILDWARRYCGTVWHLIGTCRMGPASDRSTVVSDQLKVHGLANLRVVDASVMPNIPSANTYSATMVIAEKGADLVRGRAAPAAAVLPLAS
jgi:choline dehydrogenase